jgi:hypothetical protein
LTRPRRPTPWTGACTSTSRRSALGSAHCMARPPRGSSPRVAQGVPCIVLFSASFLWSELPALALMGLISCGAIPISMFIAVTLFQGGTSSLSLYLYICVYISLHISFYISLMRWKAVKQCPHVSTCPSQSTSSLTCLMNKNHHLSRRQPMKTEPVCVLCMCVLFFSAIGSADDADTGSVARRPRARKVHPRGRQGA